MLFNKDHNLVYYQHQTCDPKTVNLIHIKQNGKYKHFLKLSDL